MAGRRKREWFDNDAFWRDMYPFMFTERHFQATTEQVEHTLALLQPRGQDVLDLCCGPGRFSIPLAQKGFTVTAVDRTPFLLSKGRARAKAAGAKIEWVHSDMRDFVRPKAFDLAINTFTSFGYFDDKRDDVLVLRNVLRSLRPGGLCLIELLGKERLAAILEETTSDQLPDGSLRVMRHEVFDDWTRVRNDWFILRKGAAVKSYTFHHTIYSGQELRDRMERVGFENVRLFGSLKGEPFGPRSPRLVAIGSKQS